MSKKQEKELEKQEQDKGKKIRFSERNKQDVLDNWKANREMGKKKYIIKFGVVTWGISTFVIYWILMFVLNAVTKSQGNFTIYQVIISLIFFAIFGAIYGNILWKRNEKIYKEKHPYAK